MGRRIEVVDQPLFSPWNTTQSGSPARLPGVSPPLTSQAVKSAFELPWDGVLPPAAPRAAGPLVVGRGPVPAVDVCTDGGASWRRAQLHGPNRGGAWARWSIPWTPRRRGRTELLARATDAYGRRQPERVPFNCEGYMFWPAVRHPLTISA